MGNVEHAPLLIIRISPIRTIYDPLPSAAYLRFSPFLTFRDHLHFFVFTIIFQYCLFSVMSSVSSYIFISSRVLSIHLRLGRPLLFPGTTMSIIFLDRLSSSFLLICPYQFNRFCLENVDIWHTLASYCIIWFLTWSFLVLLFIHRSILISATCNLFSSFFLTAQHSAPYVIVGLITVLCTLSFSLMGTFCRIAQL